MRKNLRICALIIIAITFSANVAAAGWLEDCGEFFGNCWDSIVEFFSSDSSEIKSESGKPLPKNIASKWDSLTSDLTKALALRDNQENLPDHAWFGEDKISNAAKINELLDVALKILVQAEAENVRQDAANLKKRIANDKARLDEIRNRKISAPEKSYLPWEMTRAKADKEIAELNRDIQEAENALNSINSRLTEALRKIGLELEQNQVDILLNSVTGDDLLQNAIIFANVKSVVEKLEELSKNESNTFDITRRYTGMYLILNDLLIHTQEALLQKIDNEYKPGLELIIQEALTLQRDATNKSRQRIYTSTQRQLFEKNADSNATTIRVAKLYQTLLNAQRNRIFESVRALRKNRDLAENTYRTVKSSGELRSLIHSGLVLFDTIDALSMPELKPFESDIIKLEFEEINRRLLKK